MQWPDFGVSSPEIRRKCFWRIWRFSPPIDRDCLVLATSGEGMMKPSGRGSKGDANLFRSRLDEMINLRWRGWRGCSIGTSSINALSRWADAPAFRRSMTRWRQRIGAAELAALAQESLAAAHRSGALRPKDLERITAGATVEANAATFPTDATRSANGGCGWPRNGASGCVRVTSGLGAWRR
jgi:hypothetical protein